MRRAWLTVVAIVAASCSCEPEGNGGTGGAAGAAGFGGFGASGAGGTSGASGFGGFGGAGFGGFSGSAGVSGGAGGVGGTGCATGRASAARVTPTVMLVVDGSCSMSTPYPASGGADAIICTSNPGNRWTAVRNALVDPTNGIVTRLAGVVKFGLGVYGTAGTCPFVLGRIDPVLDNAPAITNGLPTAPPGLFTPTAEALNEVYGLLPDATQVIDQDVGPQIVILATDGAPNGCNASSGQPESVAAVMAGQQKHITTFVISLADPSNAALQQHLDQLAMIGDPGNAAAHAYAPTDPAALSNTLEQIIGGAVSCGVTLNGRVTVGFECDGTVQLNGSPLVCNDANGWRLVDESHIELQGTACDQFKGNPQAVVTADFPCDVFIPG